ncbi:uncharacterized protein P884DRAFT_259558 [Thermothelomyces heterothallicus CBS 202.75]|uniref:uncharacterized protein n=1 Tax=Thermothelomyces heterothallicus CBS 202.75 TaxID=1149848 RepID=UPI003742208E
MLWLLMGVECAFARGMNAAACLVAGYKLLLVAREEGVGRVALRKAIQGKLLQGCFVACHLVYYLMGGIGPAVWRSSVSAARGQPGSLLTITGFVWGVWMLLRYRSTFFIALEVSGFFIFLGYVVFGLGVLAWEFIDDPLGLKVHTALDTFTGIKGE